MRAQLASCCAHENLNLKTNRSKFSVVLSYINETTMGRIINSMPNKNSIDEYRLSNALLKKTSFSLTTVLTTLFNDSIEKRFFPECLKHATVVAVHKGGDTENPRNFRPISLLPLNSKVLEKILSDQICSFLEKNSILSHKQRLSKENINCTCLA